MCGIAGYISNKSLIKDNCINPTLELMKNRGPDNRSYIVKKYDNKDEGQNKP